MVVVYSIVLLKVSSKISIKVVHANHVSIIVIHAITKHFVEVVLQVTTISVTILVFQPALLIPATFRQIFQE
jgi:hypothetical protein